MSDAITIIFVFVPLLGCLAAILVHLLRKVYEIVREQDATDAEGNLKDGVNNVLLRIGDLNANFETGLDKLGDHLKRSFTSIISSRQGKLGEMEALFALKERYIRLIPLGQPIDFIGIGNDVIDFIEIKTGKARMTKAERKISELVEAGKVRFRLMREEDFQ